MKLSSDLPITHMGFAHWHTDDTEVGIIIAKACFTLSSDGTTQPQTPPPDLEMADKYEADPSNSALLFEQDIAPQKRKTDLVIRGSARSFEAEPLPGWTVAVEIADVLHHGFVVRGPSVWEKQRSRWHLSEPDPVPTVPMSYAVAYGGSFGEDGKKEFFDQNPAGIGFISQTAASHLQQLPAPQIGLQAEFMTGDPFATMSVQGTMPMAKTWLPRRALAGTFDDTWKRTRHPRMPKDYDLAFWNISHPRLQIKSHLEGDETISLTGLSHLRHTFALQLPGEKLVVRSKSNSDAPDIAMTLDTVDVDVEKVDDGSVSITLLWRAMLIDSADYEAAEIIRG